jgi:hypothetical protein
MERRALVASAATRFTRARRDARRDIRNEEGKMTKKKAAEPKAKKAKAPKIEVAAGLVSAPTQGTLPLPPGLPPVGPNGQAQTIPMPAWMTPEGLAAYLPVVPGATSEAQALRVQERAHPGPAAVGVPLYARVVRSNLKGGVSCLLGPRTLLVGANGLGKSAVIEAVSLALRGRVADLGWHSDIAAANQLLALRPEDSDELKAEVELAGDSDMVKGAMASWQVFAKTGSKKPVHTIPSVVNPARVFPLDEIREALRGSAETQRKFFLGRVVGNLTEADVLKALPDKYHAKVRAVGFQPKAGDPLEISDMLVNALEGAKKMARQATSRVNAHEGIQAEMQGGLAPRPVEGDLINAANATKLAGDVLQAVAGAMALGDADGQLAQVNAEARTLMEKIAELEGHQQPSSAPPVDPIWGKVQEVLLRPDILTLALRMMGWQLEITVEQAQNVHAQIQAAVGASLNAQIQFRQVASALEIARNRLMVLRTQYDELVGRKQRASLAPPGVTLEQARAALTAAQTHEVALRELNAKYEAAHKSMSLAQEEKTSHDEWKNISNDLGKLVKRFLADGLEAFKARVNHYMPMGHLFGMDVKEKTVEVGLLADPFAPGGLRTALSEGEKVFVSLAIAAALSEGYKGLVILVPEDRAFAPEVLREVMTALSRAPFQVLMAHPIPPDVLPEGWTIIDTGKGEHRSLSTPAGVERAKGGT